MVTKELLESMHRELELMHKETEKNIPSITSIGNQNLYLGIIKSS